MGLLARSCCWEVPLLCCLARALEGQGQAMVAGYLMVLAAHCVWQESEWEGPSLERQLAAMAPVLTAQMWAEPGRKACMYCTHQAH